MTGDPTNLYVTWPEPRGGGTQRGTIGIVLTGCGRGCRFAPRDGIITLCMKAKRCLY